MDQTVHHAGRQVIRQLLACVFPHLPVGQFVLVTLHQASPQGVIRTRPTMLKIERVPQRVECLLPVGRRDVERPAGGQFDPWRDHVDMTPAPRFTVQNGAPAVLVWPQSGEGGAFKLPQNLVNFRRAGVVGGRKSDHTGRVSVHSFQAVDQPADLLRITAQNTHFLPNLAGVIALSSQVIGRFPARPG